MEFHQPAKLPPLKSITTAGESQHEQNVSVFILKKNSIQMNKLIYTCVCMYTYV